MQARVWINEIEFSDGTQIVLNENDIIVFVGPNNAGKSASLKEIASSLRVNNKQGKVIKDIKISKQGNESAFIAFLNNFQKEYNSNPLPSYKGLGFNLYESNAISWWNNSNQGLSDLSNAFSNSLTTEQRLTAANPPNNIRLVSEAPQHPIHFLQKHDTLEKTFSDYFRQAFGMDLIVHRNAGNEVPLYVGQRPVMQTGEDRLSESYQDKLEKLDLLHKQGDGMRSFVGVLLNAFTSNYNILFIDEPEAFLHPPQAKLLGKMLAKDIPSERQLFLATHSEDFLKGLLDANASNLKIIRIERHDAINRVSHLDNSDIKEIWSDSFLRHSNTLNGLFHTKVVICESDSDSRFYSALLDAKYDNTDLITPDLLFINCGGKHRIPTIITSLMKLNVPIRIITDFDVLDNKNPLQFIYEKLGGNWEEIKSDWKIVKESIDTKRPELETKELKDEVDKIFSSTTEKIFPKEKIKLIENQLKKASAWSHAKESGRSFIPNGDAIKAYERLLTKVKSKGLFIVEIGEAESFVKSVGNHGPKWVNEVLSKELKNDPELEPARKFIEEVIK